MRPLTTITITVDKMGGDHVLITVTGLNFDEPEFADVPEVELDGAARYIAGLLARVGMTARPFIGFDGQSHGCDQRFYTYSDHEPTQGRNAADVCGLDSFPLNVKFYDTAALYLTVPRGKQRVWLKMISGWLEQVSA